MLKPNMISLKKRGTLTESHYNFCGTLGFRETPVEPHCFKRHSPKQFSYCEDQTLAVDLKGCQKGIKISKQRAVKTISSWQFMAKKVPAIIVAGAGVKGF